MLSRRDDGKPERLGSSTHASVVRHDGSKIRPEAEGCGQVDRIKRSYGRRLDLRSPLENFVIQPNEINAGELPSRSLHQSWQASPSHGAEELHAQKRG